MSNNNNTKSKKKTLLKLFKWWLIYSTYHLQCMAMMGESYSTRQMRSKSPSPVINQYHSQPGHNLYDNLVKQSSESNMYCIMSSVGGVLSKKAIQNNFRKCKLSLSPLWTYLFSLSVSVSRYSGEVEWITDYLSVYYKFIKARGDVKWQGAL